VSRPAPVLHPQRPTRLVYLGTPAMAVPPLRAIVDAGFDVALVVTRPDTRRGRGNAQQPSPVKVAAIERGLPVSHDVDDALAAGADLGVVVAYGRLIKPHVLDAIPMVNLHFSLLPRWRGAAPVERALLAGDSETGVAVMGVEDALDTGFIYAERTIPIKPTDTAHDLRIRLVAEGSELLVESLTSGLPTPRPQVGEPTYAAKILPDELRIDWTHPAGSIDRLVRLGGAFTTFRGKRLKIWGGAITDTERVPDPELLPERNATPGALVGEMVVCGNNSALTLREVQPEGRARVPFVAWRNGAQPVEGERFGTEL